VITSFYGLSNWALWPVSRKSRNASFQTAIRLFWKTIKVVILQQKIQKFNLLCCDDVFFGYFTWPMKENEDGMNKNAEREPLLVYFFLKHLLLSDFSLLLFSAHYVFLSTISSHLNWAKRDVCLGIQSIRPKVDSPDTIRLDLKMICTMD